MNAYFIHTIIIAAEGAGDETIFVQILVLIIVASAWGLYNFVRKKTHRFADDRENLAAQTGPRRTTIYQQQAAIKLPKDSRKNVNSGMDVLEIGFLIDVVENTESNDINDVTMQGFSFNEVLRRKNQNRIDSSVLKTYAVNKGNRYSKNIQREALKELSARTARTP